MKQRYDRPLTPEELAQIPDDQIDTTDIAELDADFWASAKVTPPRIKPNVSLRIPVEVIDFFKANNPKGYTARMAAVLAAYARAHRPEKQSNADDH